MIKNLEVRNFKSIKHLKLGCRRVNIFIGKPNTGKSNILESIGIFSVPYGNLRDFVRFEYTSNLFYDQDLDEQIEITADNIYCEIKFENGKFIGNGGDKEKKIFNFGFECDYSESRGSGRSGTSPFKFYRFAVMDFLTILNFSQKEYLWTKPINILSRPIILISFSLF